MLSGSDVSAYVTLTSASDENSAPETPTLDRPEVPVEISDKPAKKKQIRSASNSRRASSVWPSDGGTTLDSDFTARSLVPVDELEKLSNRTRAMSLYRAYIGVLGCREAMWEELKLLLRSRREVLVECGWEDKFVEDRVARSRFEELFARYQS